MIEDTQTVEKEVSAKDKDQDKNSYQDKGSNKAGATSAVAAADSTSEAAQEDRGRDVSHDINETRQAKLAAVAEPPGRILRRAREAKGLEQIEIARELKLDVALIDALERGDLHRLPPVYAAGYIRAYAKRVDLAPDELVSEYIAQEATHAPKLKKDSSNPLPERYRRVAEALPKGFSLAAANAKEQLTKNYGPLAAGLVILILLVWQVISIWSSDEADTGSDIVAMKTVEDDSHLPMPSEKEQADSLNAQLTEKSGNNSAEAKSSEAAKSDKSVAAGEKSAKTPQIEQPSETAKSASNPNTGAKTSETPDAIALLEKKNITDLVLTFNRNSWVDIRDASGKHIIRQLGIAGNTAKVSGQAPFQVLLGYGHGVTIEYNGNEVDFSAFQGDRVARFTLEVPKKKVSTE